MALRLAALGALSLIATAPTTAQAQDASPVPEIVLLATSAASVTGFYVPAIHDNVVDVQGTVSRTLLTDSIRGHLGIAQLNQDAGSLSSQANLVLIAAAAGAVAAIADVHLDLHVAHGPNTLTIADATRSNLVRDVLAGSAGIVQVNQSAGTLNTNVNVLALTIGLAANSAVSLGDVSLSASSAASQGRLEGTVSQSNVISGLSDFTGVAQFSQAAGDGNVVMNSMAIGVVVVNR